jgi:hypothetical protein
LLEVDANDGDLMAFHRIIFETFGEAGLRKDNLLQFNDFGFPESIDEFNEEKNCAGDPNSKQDQSCKAHCNE